MAVSAYSSGIQGIMSREMKDLGQSIIKQQCKKVGVDFENIGQDDLPRVARAISEVMVVFGGREKAKRLYNEIKRLTDLDHMVESEKNPKAKLGFLLEMGETARITGEWPQGIKYLNEAIDMASGKENEEILSKAERALGNLLNDKNVPKEALLHFERALPTAERLKKFGELAAIERGIGYANWRLGNYEETFSHYNKALEAASEENDPAFAGRIMTDFGLAYESKGEYGGAKKRFEKAIEILTHTQDNYQLARAHNNLGEIYKHEGDLRKAIQSYELCLTAAKMGNNKMMMGYAYCNSAECYAKIGYMDKAKKNADKTLEIFTKVDDKYMVSGAHMVYGIIHSKDLNIGAMNKSFKTAISMLKELNYPYEIGTNTYEYAKVLKAHGFKARAIEEYKSALEILKKINSTKFIEKITKELETLGVEV